MCIRDRLGFKFSKGVQGPWRVTAEGIGLDHAHIPAAGANLHGIETKQIDQERLGNHGTDHQSPVRSKPMQLLKHGGIPGRMTKAMTAAADVNQHG